VRGARWTAFLRRQPRRKVRKRGPELGGRRSGYRSPTVKSRGGAPEGARACVIGTRHAFQGVDGRQRRSGAPPPSRSARDRSTARTRFSRRGTRTGMPQNNQRKETECRLTASASEPSLRGAKGRSNPDRKTLDCFAEPVIGPREARTRWLAMTESGPASPDRVRGRLFETRLSALLRMRGDDRAAPTDLMVRSRAQRGVSNHGHSHQQETACSRNARA
jgi:hypothetical protein